MVIEDRGQVRTCLNHPDRTAVARCGRCHKPLCSECVISTADGKFCSRTCAGKAADFRSAYQGPVTTRPGFLQRLVKPLVYLALLVALLALVNKYGFRIPWLGGILEKIPGLSRTVPR